jgi:tRNA-binding protein
MATIDDFLELDIRVGRIVEVREFPEARKPAYQLMIDFGPEIGVKRSSAQLVARYSIEDLTGKLVLAVVNFPPRRIGPFESEVLTLGVPDAEGRVVLIGPDAPDVVIGGRLF